MPRYIEIGDALPSITDVTAPVTPFPAYDEDELGVDDDDDGPYEQQLD